MVNHGVYHGKPLVGEVIIYQAYWYQTPDQGDDDPPSVCDSWTHKSFIRGSRCWLDIDFEWSIFFAKRNKSMKRVDIWSWGWSLIHRRIGFWPSFIECFSWCLQMNYGQQYHGISDGWNMLKQMSQRLRHRGTVVLCLSRAWRWCVDMPRLEAFCSRKWLDWLDDWPSQARDQLIGGSDSHRFTMFHVLYSYLSWSRKRVRSQQVDPVSLKNR